MQRIAHLWIAVLCALSWANKDVFKAKIVKEYDYSVLTEVGISSFEANWSVVLSGGRERTDNRESDEQLLIARSRTSAHAYQNSPGDVVNPVITGRVLFQTKLSDDFDGVIFFSMDSLMEEAATFRPVKAVEANTVEASIDNTNAKLDATIKNRSSMTVGGFLQYNHMGFGIAYDMKSYSTSGHGLNSKKLNLSSLKDSVVLFGFRGRSEFEMEEFGRMYVYCEFFSNISYKGSSKEPVYEYFSEVYNQVGIEGIDGVVDVDELYKTMHKASIGVGLVATQF